VGEVTERLEALLRGAIERGELKPGDRLPSERTIAVEQGAGRTTVRLVLAKLAAQGLIEAQHGRGYFVKAQRKGSAR
jgi:GntR family transcriptional regulator